MILVFIGIFIALVYTTVMCIKLKTVPKSISDTMYLGGGNWFTYAMVLSSILVTIGMMMLTEESNWQFLSFLTGASLGFVGTAKNFKEKLEGFVHYGAAILMFTCSQLWVIIFCSAWPMVTWLSILAWYRSNQKMFWCEITCIINILVGLLFFYY